MLKLDFAIAAAKAKKVIQIEGSGARVRASGRFAKQTLAHLRHYASTYQKIYADFSADTRSADQITFDTAQLMSEGLFALPHALTWLEVNIGSVTLMLALTQKQKMAVCRPYTVDATGTLIDFDTIVTFSLEAMDAIVISAPSSGLCPDTERVAAFSLYYVMQLVTMLASRGAVTEAVSKRTLNCSVDSATSKFDYRLIKCGEDRTAYAVSNKTNITRGAHVVRSHIRVLKSGKRTTVKGHSRGEGTCKRATKVLAVI